MDTFEKLLDFQKDLLNSQLKVIYRYQQRTPLEKRKGKRRSQLDIVENILSSSDKALHISAIIDIAQRDYNITLERDSVVSALIKKVKAGKRFIKVAPNTFTLKND